MTWEITARDLLQSLVYPSISFSGDFHGTFESRACSEETEISVPTVVGLAKRSPADKIQLLESSTFCE